MVGIINYGMGNTGSIFNMLKKTGIESVVTNDKDVLKKVDKLILPGVGTFEHGMRNLCDLNLVEIIRELALDKEIPLLGICLGMQLLGISSEESMQPTKGLGLIPFNNVKFHFQAKPNLKIPHMGWDIVNCTKESIFSPKSEEKQRFYFVHSYHAVCESKENVIMTCDYGYEFPAAINKKNIYGVQFHPEKSHRFGMRLLEQFVR